MCCILPINYDAMYHKHLPVCPQVADLKKELKIRGLATTGKRNELLDRLQVALAAGMWGGVGGVVSNR